MNKEKDAITQDEIKRRKSAKITVLPNMNIFSKNSDKSSSAQLTPSPPLKFKSTSLFAYQELDQFSSFCDNESFPLDILSYVNDNQNINKNRNRKMRSWCLPRLLEKIREFKRSSYLPYM